MDTILTIARAARRISQRRNRKTIALIAIPGYDPLSRAGRKTS
jgi:hypothetical protein